MSKITHVERGHFDMIYDLASSSFPTNCTKCGRDFQNELDYTMKTVVAEGPIDYTEVGFGFYFMRNHIYKERERRNR